MFRVSGLAIQNKLEPPQSETIAFLCDPGLTAKRIPSTESAPHISHIFLGGSCVYELKRAMKLLYLDHGSSEQRRHFCGEEVRISRLSAPNL